MGKLNWTLAATFAGGLALAGNPASAQQNVNCTGTLPAGTYNNVNVPQNVGCQIAGGVTVQGNVTVAAGATLNTASATIHGSVLANNAASVVLGLAGAEPIGKNVILVGTTGQASVLNDTIGGNVQISGSTANSALEINDNSVTGNVTVQSNNSASDVILNNAIGGNLVCAGNTPPPSGGNITVGGHKVGQCSGL